MENNIEVSDVHNYSLDIKSREIYLHSQSSHNEEEDPGVDYRMATNVIKNISILDNISSKPITIKMFSIGGDWGSGMAIFDAISHSKSYITVIAYGQSESMSSIILQAADYRVLSPHCYVMCHFGSNAYAGNYLDAQASAKMDKRMNSTMLDIYAEKLINSEFFKVNYTNGNIEKARNYLFRKLKGGDWYLNSSEAIYYGFADSLLSDKNA